MSHTLSRLTAPGAYHDAPGSIFVSSSRTTCCAHTTTTTQGRPRQAGPAGHLQVSHRPRRPPRNVASPPLAKDRHEGPRPGRPREPRQGPRRDRRRQGIATTRRPWNGTRSPPSMYDQRRSHATTPTTSSGSARTTRRQSEAGRRNAESFASAAWTNKSVGLNASAAQTRRRQGRRPNLRTALPGHARGRPPKILRFATDGSTSPRTTSARRQQAPTRGVRATDSPPRRNGRRGNRSLRKRW